MKMSKSVLNKKAVEKLLDRLDNLQVNHKALWGKMSPVEMLLHCNLANKQVLVWNKPVRPGSFKQKIFKFIGLEILPRFPKNTKSAKQFITSARIDDKEFLEQKSVYRELLSSFSIGDKTLTAPHPYFGPLNTSEWGRVMWKHMDHHLRQFGH